MDGCKDAGMDGWMGECMAECEQPISAAILAQTTFATSPLLLLRFVGVPYHLQCKATRAIMLMTSLLNYGAHQ